MSASAEHVARAWSVLAGTDERVAQAASRLTGSRPRLASLLVGWQELTQPRWVYLAATGVCVNLAWCHGRRRPALWGFGTMMGVWNLALDLKVLTRRPRPVVFDPVSPAPGYSFPSGHAANAAAAAAVVTLLLRPVLKTPSARYAVTAGALAFVTVTATDRVLLAAHYLSDVVAGILLGSGLVWASYAGYRRSRVAQPKLTEV